MTEIVLSVSGTLTEIYPRAGGAAQLAELARDLRSSRPSDLDVGGISLHSDHIGIARSAHFAAEVEAASRAMTHSTHAISLLDSADEALSEISGRLDDLEALAEDAADASLSAEERARLDAAFQSLKSEIDALAEDASFDGVDLLTGDGTGGALRIEFLVGDGTAEHDRIEVSIDAARVSDLSGDLEQADLQTTDAVTAAADAVTDAQDALGAIRAQIAGDRARLGSAFLASQERGAVNESARAALADPSVAADLARIVAEQVAEESVVPLTDGADRQLRSLLTRLDAVTLPEEERTDAMRTPASAAWTPQPLTAEPAASVPET